MNNYRNVWLILQSALLLIGVAANIFGKSDVMKVQATIYLMTSIVIGAILSLTRKD